MQIQRPKEFDDFYREHFGSRWEALVAALGQPDKKVLRLTKYYQGERPDLEEVPWLPNCYWINESSGEHIQRQGELLVSYVMDPASVLAARSLPLGGAQEVLDMCSAPGGKSLILFEEKGDKAHLIVNEPSPPRRERLKSVLRQYLPDAERSHLSVKGIDGVKFALKAKESFDAILVDAPCSGERHLLQTPKELQAWKVSRTKGLAKKQYALLSAAAEAIKSGGYILYATCSISPLENDAVVDRLIHKRKDQLELVPLVDPSGLGEVSQHGLRFLPDQCGFGPLYFSLLKKRGALDITQPR